MRIAADDARLRRRPRRRDGHAQGRSNARPRTLAEYWTLGKRAAAAGCCSRSSRTPRAATTSTRRLVASPWGDDARLRDEARDRAARWPTPCRRRRGRRARRPRLRRRRARGRARPLARRRPLRARRARGRGAPRGRGAGPRRSTATTTRSRRSRTPAAVDGAALRRRRGGSTRARRARPAAAARCGSPRSTPAPTPPTMTVEVEVAGRRYVEDRDTAAVLGGIQGRARRTSPSAGRSRSTATRTRRGGSPRPREALSTAQRGVGRDDHAARRPQRLRGAGRGVLDALGARSASGPAARRPRRPRPPPRVFTLAGEPGTLHRALARGRAPSGRAHRHRAHAGEHPRIGVLDVAPIVFLDAAERGAACAEALLAADALARELGLPGLPLRRAGGRAHARRAAPRRPARSRADRAGELAPDYGPRALHPTAGPARLRAAAAGRVQRRDRAPHARRGRARSPPRSARAAPRALPGVRAIGLELRSRGVVQVSTNIEDHTRTTAARRGGGRAAPRAGRRGRARRARAASGARRLPGRRSAAQAGERIEDALGR